MTLSGKLIALVGPTAVGKTELSCAIAEAFSCEIIGMDSLQVYKYMDVGTAKPTPDERKRVPHHLIDIVAPDADYNAACYVRDAERAITEVAGRGRLPLLVGGTGLYLKALVHGLFVMPALGTEEKRKALRQDLKRKGPRELFEELRNCDPVAAARIHPHDTQRLIRALEVFRLTGQGWSTYLAQQEPRSSFQHILKIGLARDREELYTRINTRVVMMVEQGFLAEVQELLSMGYSDRLKSMQSIGYRHMISFLAKMWPWEETLRLLARDTRRYAKRQMTWFTREPKILWFHPSDRVGIFSAINQYLRSTAKQGRGNGTP